MVIRPNSSIHILLVLGGLLAGCGSSLSYTVSEDLMMRLPKDSRRSEFQAKTIVTIAVDELANTKRELTNGEREIDRIQEKIRDAEKSRQTVGAREADKIDLEIEMLDAKADYLRETVKHQRLVVELSEMLLVLARARFELAKVRLVKKHSIAFDGDEEDFDQQVKDIEEDVNDFRKKVDADAAELKLEEEKWLAVKKKYYSAIGESSKGWWTE